jgi:hypothetical protein
VSPSVTRVPGQTATVAAGACTRCGKPVRPADRVVVGDHSYCGPCHEAVLQQIEDVVGGMSTNVNYPMAVVGAVLGGAVGAAFWWGFIVLTDVAFDLVAVAIGFLVGRGTTRFAGRKRSHGLQVLSAGVALASFLAAAYLVNVAHLNRGLVERGASWRVPMWPAHPLAFWDVATVGFGVVDLLLLVVVLWQAWELPAPVKLRPRDNA